MAAKSLTPQELRIWGAFQDMGEEVRGRVGRDISEATGLSGPEFGVLSRLVGFGNGEMRQQELAKDEMGKKSSLSPANAHGGSTTHKARNRRRCCCHRADETWPSETDRGATRAR